MNDSFKGTKNYSQGECTTMSIRTVKSGFIGTLCIIAFSAAVWAQDITFNSPSPWLTLRNDSLMIKAQLDTSKFPKKKITLTASRVEAGKKKQITSKTFTVSDFTQDFNLGLAGGSLLGGRDFLKINWNVPGTKDSGVCAPVGIVNLDKTAKTDSLHAAKKAGGIDVKNVAAVAAGLKFAKIKDQEVAFAWTAAALVVVCKKSPSAAALRFVIDGKNGKNAFAAFSDKMVEYFPAKDSVYSYVNERSYADSIMYRQKAWTTELAKGGDKDYGVLTIPWYDIGIGKPFDGRVMGFSVFALSDKDAVLAAYPEKAATFIPGSWGNLVLDK
jgi:hypothetical protein